jgi:hypothetical protein
MAKKKTTMENEIELQPETTEVAPITKTETIDLKNGYVQIREIGKEGNGVIVKAIHFGKIYPESKWEIIATKKK